MRRCVVLKFSLCCFILLLSGVSHAAIKLKTTVSYVDTEKTLSAKCYSAMMWVKVDADTDVPIGCLVTIGHKGVHFPTALGLWAKPKLKRLVFWNGKFKESEGNIFPLGRWVHVTVSGTTEKPTNIYLNGELTWTTYPQNPIKSVIGRIGANLVGEEVLKGVSYDEVSFWSRELDQSEIKTNYNKGKGRALAGSETGLEAYWKCEPGTGNYLADSQLNGTICKGFITGKAGVDYKWVEGVKVAESLVVVNPVPTLTADALSDSSIKVVWGELSEASGYEITVSTNENLKNPIYSSIIQGNSKIFNNLKASTDYYFSVRTEREANFSPRMTVKRRTYGYPLVSGNTKYYHYPWKTNGRFLISNVSTKGGIDGHDIKSNTSAGVTEYLSDYTHQHVNVKPGGNFELSVSLKDLHGAFIGARVWIDWNCDGDFDDQNELVKTLGQLGRDKSNRSQTYKFKVQVPSNAVDGFARMRIRAADSGHKQAERLDSRGFVDHGGTAQDYTVVIGDAASMVKKTSVNNGVNGRAVEKKYEFAPEIRNGHILKASKCSARKIKWIAKSGSHSYLEPKSGMKFVEMFVKIKKGYSISVADYNLCNAISSFKAKSLATDLTGSEFKEYNQIGKADKKDRVFKLLYEVPDNVNVFNVVFALETSLKQPTIGGLSFTQTKSLPIK